MDPLAQAREELTGDAVARLLAIMHTGRRTLAGLRQALREVLEEHARGWRRVEARRAGEVGLRPGSAEARRRGRLGGQGRAGKRGRRRKEEGEGR